MDVIGAVCGLCGLVSWGAALRRVALCAAAVLAMFSDAFGMASPHDSDKPKFCLNCHTEEIYTKNCNENEGYCLLAGSVDGLCLTCHLKEDCCKPGLEHLPRLYLGKHSHPTDIEARDIPRADFPKTLPLFQGRITCRTCHLHTAGKPDDYKMLRLVKISGKGVDWSVLCLDCHQDH